MTKDRLLKLLNAKAENTKRIAERSAHENGFERAIDIPVDGAVWAACLHYEWCCITGIIHMLEDDKFAEDLFKIYLPEEQNNAETTV
jgi:hypothetical protein